MGPVVSERPASYYLAGRFVYRAADRSAFQVELDVQVAELFGLNLGR